ncbi:5,6-dimethylbenzimidazole synthase [Aestuariibius sp. 2305UL40-4]|uniref:5,6-dimethylbenzimidazole synthase n=1 Tax=Aestuariibius violaceus TaxID=3234132 RepID=UPI00398E9A26
MRGFALRAGEAGQKRFLRPELAAGLRLMKMTKTHRAALTDILTWRRDVRHFRPDPVPEAVMAEVMASVDLAPSVGNSRPWRFVRVRSAAARDAVIASFERCNAAASEGYGGAEQARYRALKLAGLREAPEHLAVFTDPDPAEGRGLGRQTMPETLDYSTVMAIHTLWLTGRARGLGVGWVSILDPGVVRAALEVPAAWRLTGYLCLGYPEAESTVPELEEQGWQARAPSVWLER